MIRSLLFGICSLLFLAMSQCTSIKELSNPSFIGETSYYSTWVAGIEGGGSGLDFYIDLINIPGSITPIELYFKGKKAPVVLEKETYVVHFKTAANSKPEEVSSISASYDPTKFPFELGVEEAILMYKENGKIQYTKIDKIKKKGHIAFPSAGKQNPHH